jgi:hypothetical protein
MLVEEEEPKSGDVNPDALEAVFEEEIIVEEETFLVEEDGGDDDEVEIAFDPNDEGYW